MRRALLFAAAAAEGKDTGLPVLVNRAAEPGVRGPREGPGEKRSDLSCGGAMAGDDTGEESRSYNVRLVAAAGVAVVDAGGKASFCLLAECGVAATRYVLSSTRCKSGSLLLRRLVDGWKAEGGSNGEEPGASWD